MKLQFLPISLHFSVLSSNFPLLDPDPGEKMTADPNPQPCQQVHQLFFTFFYNTDPDHDSIILPDSDQQSLEFEESRT